MAKPRVRPPTRVGPIASQVVIPPGGGPPPRCASRWNDFGASGFQVPDRVVAHAGTQALGQEEIQGLGGLVVAFRAPFAIALRLCVDARPHGLALLALARRAGDRRGARRVRRGSQRRRGRLRRRNGHVVAQCGRAVGGRVRAVLPTAGARTDKQHEGRDANRAERGKAAAAPRAGLLSIHRSTSTARAA
jgi:hypothetical protein